MDKGSTLKSPLLIYSILDLVKEKTSRKMIDILPGYDLPKNGAHINDTLRE